MATFEKGTEMEADENQGVVAAAAQACLRNVSNVGLAIGVIMNGQRQWFGYGKVARESDTIPNEHTVLEIGSITKAFTVILLADMAQRGEVALDDPVQKFLPASVRMPMRKGAQITLEQLATHKSSLPRLPDNYFEGMKDEKNPCAHYTVEQLYAYLSQAKLTRDLGTAQDYSNLGVGLLGHALELRAGMTYEQLVTEQLLRPLGMNDTSVTLTDDQRARLAAGHDESGNATPLWDIPVLGGAGALRSTAGDMLKFMAAQLGEAPAALQPAIEATHQPRGKAGVPVPANARFLTALCPFVVGGGIFWRWSPPPGTPMPWWGFAVWLLSIVATGYLAGTGPAIMSALLWPVLVSVSLMNKDPRYGFDDLLRAWPAVVFVFAAGLYVAWRSSTAFRAMARQDIALGWHFMQLPQSKRTALWHNGGTGGYHSFCAFVKATRTAVVVLSNSANDCDEVGVTILDGLQRPSGAASS